MTTEIKYREVEFREVKVSDEGSLTKKAICLPCGSMIALNLSDAGLNLEKMNVVYTANSN